MCRLRNRSVKGSAIALAVVPCLKRFQTRIFRSKDWGWGVRKGCSLLKSNP